MKIFHDILEMLGLIMVSFLVAVIVGVTIAWRQKRRERREMHARIAGARAKLQADLAAGKAPKDLVGITCAGPQFSTLSPMRDWAKAENEAYAARFHMADTKEGPPAVIPKDPPPPPPTPPATPTPPPPPENASVCSSNAPKSSATITRSFQHDHAPTEQGTRGRDTRR